MTTRWYLETSGTPDLQPTSTTGWENTSNNVFRPMNTTKAGTAMATITVAHDGTQNNDLLVRTFVSGPLSAGQTITGGQSIKFQMRCQEAAGANDYVYVIRAFVSDADGITVNKSLKVATATATEMSAVIYVNRTFASTTAATNYTTVAGDRIVCQMGFRSTAASQTGNASLRNGSAAASDLPEDETTETDFNPWFELADTLTFDSTTVVGTSTAVRQSRRRRR